jgi:hypothetical protein
VAGLSAVNPVVVLEGKEAHMYSFSLPNTPQYCQYGANYCGSACAQMIMNGYPSATDCMLIDQPTIYTWIQSNQVEPTPYKAPGTVRDAIHHFNHPPVPAHFVAQAYQDANDAIYAVLLWMRRTNYPAAVMIGGNHWVVVTGYETDVDPEGHSSVDLLSIDINDPLPFCG